MYGYPTFVEVKYFNTQSATYVDADECVKPYVSLGHAEAERRFLRDLKMFTTKKK